MSSRKKIYSQERNHENNVSVNQKTYELKNIFCTYEMKVIDRKDTSNN